MNTLPQDLRILHIPNKSIIGLKSLFCNLSKKNSYSFLVCFSSHSLASKRRLVTFKAILAGSYFHSSGIFGGF